MTDMINALECCIKEDCENCEKDWSCVSQWDCMRNLMRCAKAEIERLQKIIVGFMDEAGTWSNKYDAKHRAATRKKGGERDMGTSWKSQQGDGKYSLQFETNDREKYKFIEKAAQMAIDGKIANNDLDNLVKEMVGE